MPHFDNVHSELRRQLLQEHREGRAADELARQQADALWEFEGWTATDRLQVYITGMGLLRIPADEVVRLGNALLAEHEIHTRGDDDEALPVLRGRGPGHAVE